MPSNVDELSENDSLTVAEFSSLFGFPAKAIIEAIRHNRTALKKAYYSIPDLAARWNCSRATVYKTLADTGYKVFDMTREGRSRGKKLVPAETVEKIERANMQVMDKS